MAIREAVMDSKLGRTVLKTVSGYEDKPTQKEPKMKSAIKKVINTPQVTTKATKVVPKVKQSTEPKKTFKYAIMALNDDNMYVKQHQNEVDMDDEILSAFKKWLNGGDAGEFIAIRRK